MASSWRRSSVFAKADGAHRGLLSESPRCTAVVRRRSSLFPAGRRALSEAFFPQTVSEPFLARCSWAIPRAALLCPAEAFRCSECLSYRNEAILFWATCFLFMYFDVNAIVDVELHRLSGLCSLLCALCPASRGFACGSRKPVIG